ncbi:hypothetical protein [Sulfurimonas sp. CS5]|jgi:hypothetical protein|uniref:hypothetical protein n=1 Tax=Sulfurimonas sp. CS5 TaxID=3391145 RepID=UPI0039E82702
MNRVNPLHIGLLLVVIVIFLVINLSDVKSKLVEAKESYKQTAKLSTHLSGLKEVYDDKERVKRSLKRILEQSSLKSTKIEQKLKKTGIIISSHDMDINALNYLMSKLLNDSYNIVALKITELNQAKASLYVEIQW